MGKLAQAMNRHPMARRDVGEVGIVARVRDESDRSGSFHYRVWLPGQHVVVDFREDRRRDMLRFLRDAGCPASGRWYAWMGDPHL